MSIEIDRRSLLRTGALSLGALAVPAGALANSGFTHGVASGEPRARSIMLWTRYVPRDRAEAHLRWEVAAEPSFRRPLAGGQVTASPEHDHCVKPVATGLAPGRWYHYRFLDRAGRASASGRTRTLPEGEVPRFTLGIFSCANLAYGWFNAYAHASERKDLDLLVHLGDYYYEYARGKYPAAGETVRQLPMEGEAMALDSYRARHAAYRSDPDLQRLHTHFPMVMMWDDHESANDSWQGGAENHDPATEGDWSVRKAAAERAWREWLPVSDKDWASYQIGSLATLYRPETRLTARTRQLDFGAVLKGRKDVSAALSEFRDGPWHDPARTLMGAEQEAWLARELKASARAGTRWQILAQQVVMGSLLLPQQATDWIGPNAPADIRGLAQVGTAAANLGIPFNLDAWDGYPAARERLLRAALDANANFLVLSGDSHNAWAFDLALGSTPAGAEFAVQAVTSPGLEAYTPRAAPAETARAMQLRNPALRYADIEHRGYLTLTLTPDCATGEWQLLDTVRQRSAHATTRRLTVPHDTNRFA